MCVSLMMGPALSQDTTIGHFFPLIWDLMYPVTLMAAVQGVSLLLHDTWKENYRIQQSSLFPLDLGSDAPSYS